jgi:hypothetical protein
VTGRHSKESAWAIQPTRSRKGDGQHSMLEKRGTREGTDIVAPQGPRDTVKAGLPEAQSNSIHAKIHRKRA